MRNSPNGYLVSPISMNLMQEPTAFANAAEEENNGQHQHNENTLETDCESDDDSSPDTEMESSDDSDKTNTENQAKKHAVHLQTVHSRFSYRSIESLLLGNRDNIWNDMKVQRDPENICQKVVLCVLPSPCGCLFHTSSSVRTKIVDCAQHHGWYGGKVGSLSPQLYECQKKRLN